MQNHASGNPGMAMRRHQQSSTATAAVLLNGPFPRSPRKDLLLPIVSSGFAFIFTAPPCVSWAVFLVYRALMC